MAYLVNITSRAEHDPAHLYWKINAEYSDAALKWYRGLKEAILTLEERPSRCPVTRKSDKLRRFTFVCSDVKGNGTSSSSRSQRQFTFGIATGTGVD
jgi:hypothetical protein